MYVYIEQVLIDNVVIDYILLSLVRLVFRSDTSQRRLWLASVVGGVTAVFYPYLAFNFWLINAYKILTAVIMLVVAFRFSKRHLIIHMLTLCAFTYVLGGLCTAFVDNVLVANGVISYRAKVPFGVTIGLVIVWYEIFRRLLIVLMKKIKSNTNIFTVNISYNGKNIRAQSFYDSGNHLSDTATLEPISIINNKLFFDITDISMESYIRQDYTSLPDCKYVDMCTLNGKSRILTFRVEKLEILTADDTLTYDNIRLGVSHNNFNNKEYSMILNSEMM